MTAVFGRFWSTDRSLTVLLVALAVTIFVLYPLVDLGVPAGLVPTVGFSIILVSGVGAVATTRLPTVLVGALVMANLAVHWLSFWRGGTDLAAWDAAVSLVACGVLAAVVLVQVFREGPITAARIQGAVAVYLLLGLSWGFAYTLIAIARPDAFAVYATTAGVLHDGRGWTFVYFSFVTLTTVGYGDITAVHPIARSLALCEALVGTLFPAILLARLVSLELHDRQGRHGRIG